MIRRLFSFWIIPAVLLAVFYFATRASMPPSSTAVVKSAPTASIAPTAVTSATVDNCAKCHSEKTTLEELAVKKVEKSEETSGEG